MKIVIAEENKSTVTAEYSPVDWRKVERDSRAVVKKIQVLTGDYKLADHLLISHGQAMTPFFDRAVKRMNEATAAIEKAIKYLSVVDRLSKD